MSDNGMKTETLKLKLEAGKKYVDRRGRVFGPIAICGQCFCESSRMPMWYENGRIGSAREADTDMDLVAEYREPEPAEPEPCPAEPNQSILDACCGSCDRYTAEQNTVDPGTVNFITKMVDEIFDRIEEPFGKNVAEQPANQTEPQRGQFWAYNSNRKCCVFMIGKNLNGHWVSVDRHGEYEVFNGRGNMSLKFWHHEPGFENFDCPVESEKVEEQKPSPSSAEKTTEKAAKQKDDEYPQYWTALEHENAYIRLDRNGNHYCIEKDGTTTGPHGWAYVNHEGRKRLTKEEAEAMLKVNKPEPPSSPAEPPTNQQLFEMIANLRDQMNGMNERLRIVERVAAVF